MPAKFRKGIDLNGQRAINGADGTGATDLVTLQQMQAAIRGLDWKASVRAASTSAITATGPQTVDGVSVVAGNRVGRMGDGVNNGIWVVNAGAWTRADDADSDAEVTPGMAFSVEEGTANGDKAFILTTNGPIVLGTTSLTFSVLGGGGAAYTAATNGGLTLSGNAFSVQAGNGILVDATGVKVDPSVVARSYQADCVATTNPQTFTHGLGKRPTVNVVTPANDEKQYPDITITTTTITVDWGAAPTAGEYRVLAVG
jgi:hypothetical protein